jgi:hypothetical protein
VFAKKPKANLHSKYLYNNCSGNSDEESELNEENCANILRNAVLNFFSK